MSQILNDLFDGDVKQMDKQVKQTLLARDKSKSAGGQPVFEGGGEFSINQSIRMLEDQDADDAFVGAHDLEGETSTVHADNKIKNLADLQRQYMHVHKTPFYYFEPSGINQKIKSFFQNLKEVLTFCSVALLAIIFPSLFSSLMLFVAWNLLIVSRLTLMSRLKAGIGVYIFNILLVLTVGFLKFYNMQGILGKNYKEVMGVSSNQLSVSQQKVQKEYRLLLGVGAEVDENTGLINLQGSFKFEICSLILFVVGLQYTLDQYKNLKMLQSNQFLVYMVKIFEMPFVHDEKETIEIGTTNDDANKSTKEKETAYHEGMTKIAKSMKRNFINCHQFLSLSQVFFVLAFLFKLFEAMIYNGLMDIPVLLLMLFIFSLYMIRENFYFLFHFLLLIFNYVMMIVFILKIQMLIMTNITSVRDYLKATLANDIGHGDPTVQFVRILQYTFGIDYSKKRDNSYDLKELTQILFLIFGLMCVQAYLQSKWADVRGNVMRLNGKLGCNMFVNFYDYLRIRKNDREKMWERDQGLKEQAIMSLDPAKRPKKKGKKSNLSRHISKYQHIYIPIAVLWISRLLILLQICMYHHLFSFISLVWFLFSFLAPLRIVFYITTVFFLPLYASEVVFVYGSQIPIAMNNSTFRKYVFLIVPYKVEEGVQIVDFKNAMFEQTFYFVNLLCLVMMISCYKLTWNNNFYEFIFKLMYQRIKIEGRMKTMALFIMMKYLHYVMLVYLFFMSTYNINSIEEIIFILAFVLFIRSEMIFRRGQKILMIEICYSMLATYIFSLYYHNFDYDSNLLSPDKEKVGIFMKLKFWKFIDFSNQPTWKINDTDIYFRWTLKGSKVIMLLALNLLNSINSILYNDVSTIHGEASIEQQKEYEAQGKEMEQKVTREEELEIRIYYFLKVKYSDTLFILIRIKNFLYNLSLYAMLALMVWAVSYVETNIFTAIFFTLNVIILCFLIKGDGKPSTFEHLVRFSFILQIVTILVLHLNLLALLFLYANTNNTDQIPPGSNDEIIYKWSPAFYESFQYIGIKSQTKNFRNLSYNQIQEISGRKFRTIIAYFIISSFMVSYFRQQLKVLKDENAFQEKNFERLFSFTQDTTNEQREEEQKKLQSMSKEEMRRRSTNHNLSAFINESVKDIEPSESGKFIRKSKYNQYDFKQHYEDRRYTAAFMVFKLLDYWPILDWFANYGHFFSNFLIVYISLFFQVSLFTLLNIICVCVFYTMAIKRLQARAQQNFQMSGILEQTDLKQAQAITKQFKIGQLYEFLTVRRNLWTFQIFLLGIFVCIGFSSQILIFLRNHKDTGNSQQQPADWQVKLDKILFYMFIAGCYRQQKISEGDKNENQRDFFLTYGLMFLALAIEKFSINWLTNRFGCNYSRFQKFIELEVRKKLLDEKSPIMPSYNLNNYRYHYFYMDIDTLIERFKENEEEAYKLKQKALKKEDNNTVLKRIQAELQMYLHRITHHKNTSEPCNNDLHNDQPTTVLPPQFIDSQSQIRNFLPYKVACRVRKFIWFTLHVEGQSPELKISEEEMIMFKRLKYKLQIERQAKIQEHNQFEEERFVSPLAYDSDEGYEYEDGCDVVGWKWHRSNELISPCEWNSFLIKEFELKQEALPDKKFCTIEELNTLSECQKQRIKEFDEEIDYEKIRCLREFKMETLEQIIAEAVELKYKISFNKGIQMVIECSILFLICVSMMLKSNLISLIYFVIVIKYLFSMSKTIMMVHATFYIAIAFVLQYSMFMLNLNSKIIPQKIPVQFKKDLGQSDDKQFKYFIPLFFQFDMFHDLQFSSFVGIGLQKDNIASLMFDFVILFFVSMYIYNFRNPLLVKSVHKVFWQFPALSDPQQIERCTPQVQRQIKWMADPKKIDHASFRNIKKQFANQGLKGAEQYQQSQQLYLYFQQQNARKIELNDILVNYIDLKYSRVWSNDFIKEVKRYFKEQDFYFRAVKQGSVLVYLSFHVITILLVLLMAIVRQSLISFVYVIILLPNLRDAANVLNQRLFEQNQDIMKLNSEIEELTEEQARLQETNPTSSVQERKEIQLQIKEKRVQLKEKFDKLKQGKNQQQQQEEQKVLKHKKWKMIGIIQNQLLIFACIDFAIIVLSLMPQVRVPAEYYRTSIMIGIRKIWSPKWKNEMTYETYFKNDKTSYLNLKEENLIFTILNCFMLSILSLQSQIFLSYGYHKFITQKDGSMDMFVNVAELKARCQAYIYNNDKLKQIFKIQTRKEVVNATVEQLKVKLKRWREFTRTTLDTAKPILVEVKKIEKKEKNGKKRKKSTQTLIDEKKSEDKTRNTEDIQDSKQSEADDNQEKKQSEADDNQDKKQSEEDKILKNSQDSHDFDQPTPQIKKTKSVKFDLETLQMQKNKEERQKTQLVEAQMSNVSKQKYQEVLEKLSKEFVDAKMKKINCCTRFYLYINQNYVNQILFKNKDMIRAYELNNQKQEFFRTEQLNRTLYHKACKGESVVPTELESIMQTEILEYIQENLDNREGKKQFNIKFLKYLRFSDSPNKKKLLEIFELDEKVKIKDLKRSWKFTRMTSMTYKIIESLFYAVVSNTATLIYMSCLWSMYVNAGLISLFYPLYIFGYGLLEETRPRNQFWNNIYQYTIVIVCIKLLSNLSLFDQALNSYTYKQINSYINTGLYNYDSIYQTVEYIIPEILILTFCILNEIKLRLQGLYFKTEDDIETIQEGIQRNILKGDLELVKQQKLLAQSNIMNRHFASLDEQIRLEKIIRDQKQQKAQEQNERLKRGKSLRNIEEPVVEENEADKVKRRDAQFQELRNMTKLIHKSSRQFDIDESANQTNSFNDQLIKTNAIMKSLQSDELIFMEGIKKYSDSFLHNENEEDEIQDELQKCDCLSAADFELDCDFKMDAIEEQKTPKAGYFEKNEYFNGIFPAFKVQKPGKDYYLSTTIILGLMFLYILICFQFMSVDQNLFLKNQNDNIYKGEQVLMLFIVIFIIIIERYICRSDTKEVYASKKLTNNEQKFFDQEQFFRQQTARSMSVKIRTMKTSDLEIQENEGQAFLNTIQDEISKNNVDEARTIITRQQKTKYLLHMTLLVVIHIYVFWFLPISGNTKLYGSAACNEKEKQFYGCKNFQDNWALRVFYVLCVLYLIQSALQLRRGFPNIKTASSVLSLDNCYGPLCSNIYMQIPFALELRGLLDYTFCKTSMDVYQFMQLFVYHKDLYNANIGNRWYRVKIVGQEQPCCEKVQCGWLLSGLVLVLLIGPLVFFSDLSNFVEPNPVQSAKLFLSLSTFTTFNSYQEMMNKDLNMSAQGVKVDQLPDERINSDSTVEIDQKIYQKKSYQIWQNRDVTFLNWNEEFFKNSKFSQWTETRFFSYKQVQDAIASQYPDQKMLISLQDQSKMKERMLNSLQLNQSSYNFSLQFEQLYTRKLPKDYQNAGNTSNIYLNFSKYQDCQTRIQLKEIFDVNCSQPSNSNFQKTAIFQEAYYPNWILGASDKADPIIRETTVSEDQRKDILLTFACPDSWSIMTNKNYLSYSDTDKKQMTTNNQTCDLLDNSEENKKYVQSLYLNKTTFNANATDLNSTFIPQQLRMTLLSMLVSGSILAAFNLTTFYTIITVGAAGTLRSCCIGTTYMMWQYENRDCEALVKLCEAVYLRRHEVDLVGEEECYRMIVEILRQPELVRVLCGSALRGPCGPEYDKLSSEDKKKMAHLDNLQKKGFEVEALRAKILDKYKEK